MTKELTTTGMIIKETKVGEGNKIFTILTDGLGKVCASGAGVRSYKSKISSGCALFCYSEFLLKKSKHSDIYNISSAEKKMDFFDIRYDIEKLALVNYICDLSNRVTMQNEDCKDVLRLLLNTVYYIHKNEYSHKIKPVFELRLLCEIGFGPDLFSCEKCGSRDNLCYFSTDTSSMRCSLCSGKPNIPNDVLLAMRYICTTPQKSVFNFKIEDEPLKVLSTITEQLILHNIGHSPKSLSYLKSLH